MVGSNYLPGQLVFLLELHCFCQMWFAPSTSPINPSKLFLSRSCGVLGVECPCIIRSAWYMSRRRRMGSCRSLISPRIETSYRVLRYIHYEYSISSPARLFTAGHTRLILLRAEKSTFSPYLDATSSVRGKWGEYSKWQQPFFFSLLCPLS